MQLLAPEVRVLRCYDPDSDPFFMMIGPPEALDDDWDGNGY